MGNLTDASPSNALILQVVLIGVIIIVIAGALLLAVRGMQNAKRIRRMREEEQFFEQELVIQAQLGALSGRSGPPPLADGLAEAAAPEAAFASPPPAPGLAPIVPPRPLPVPAFEVSPPASAPAPPRSPAPALVPAVIGRDGALPGAVGPEALGQRLFALRLLNDREGKVAMPTGPDGLIYRMRSGGTALVLPRVESAELMGYFAKRFDMVFAELPSGDVLVVERLQTRLPSLLDEKM